MRLLRAALLHARQSWALQRSTAAIALARVLLRLQACSRVWLRMGCGPCLPAEGAKEAKGRRLRRALLHEDGRAAIQEGGREVDDLVQPCLQRQREQGQVCSVVHKLPHDACSQACSESPGI